MARVFNVTGSCDPNLHYMVDIQENLKQIKNMIDAGDFFTINRARQYGKTTTLSALTEFLKNEYIVVFMDFQMISSADFSDEKMFVNAFAHLFAEAIREFNTVEGTALENTLITLEQALEEDRINGLRVLFGYIRKICETSFAPVVLMIDEVDSASNNQVFVDFLAQLRAYYLKRSKTKTFQSVILAGVYDVKNIRQRIRTDEEHKVNSPWNIAAEFNVNMSFSREEIEGMPKEYEEDYATGMDTDKIAGLIYEATSGYPFLVSKVCKLLDERIPGTELFPDKKSAWTEAGYREAEKILVHEKNTLFDSLTGKLIEYPELKKLLSAILFEGKTMSYAAGNPSIEIAAMLGFVKSVRNTVAVSNRIFEMVLYNQLLSEEEVNNAVYTSALRNKNQFVQNGKLHMDKVLERFVAAFTELYRDKDDTFREEIERKYFMLFLKPIINGVGHSYVETRTRDMRRTDIIVDYGGEQFVIELKIWRGQKYYADGEQQLIDYLKDYELEKGYMVIFNFNRDKKIGVTEKKIDGYMLVEAIV